MSGSEEFIKAVYQMHVSMKNSQGGQVEEIKVNPQGYRELVFVVRERLLRSPPCVFVGFGASGEMRICGIKITENER
jgi:hypothetical protein